jgi:uncharacterized protein (TIGR02147 family)
MAKTTYLLLLNELTARKNRNASYSLRAFARDLGVSVTALSGFLGKKRQLSPRNLARVAQSLSLSPAEFAELKTERKNQTVVRHLPEDRQLLGEDQFRMVADWYYLAILNLTKTKNFKSNSTWIAERLGLTKDVVEQSLDRLFRMGLIKRERQRIVRTSRPLMTTRDVPSAAIRKHHAQNLVLAEKSLHQDEVGVREFGSVTMAVNKEKLQKAKDLLLKTRQKIADLLEDSGATEVYTLSFQLFPLTKKNSEEDFQ